MLFLQLISYKSATSMGSSVLTVTTFLAVGFALVFPRIEMDLALPAAHSAPRQLLVTTAGGGYPCAFLQQLLSHKPREIIH